MKTTLFILFLLIQSPILSFAGESSGSDVGTFPNLLAEEQSDVGNVPDLLDVEPWVQEPVLVLGDPIFEDDFSFNKPAFVVNDPLEPMNRLFFQFNDKLYFWVMKPVSKGYAAVIPTDIRLCFGNFFTNLAAPIRFVNNLLQGQIGDAGVVLSRFMINSTLGILGLGDPAFRDFDFEPREADFGQTLGKWGAGPGIYFCWPGLGPSTLRDTFGFVGDAYLHPVPYITQDWVKDIGYMAVDRINTLSVSPYVYDELIRMSLDPYVASRQAYYEYRRSIIFPKKQ